MQQLHTDSVSKITVMVQPPFADSKSIECVSIFGTLSLFYLYIE